jgi:hypothetical protein
LRLKIRLYLHRLFGIIREWSFIVIVFVKVRFGFDVAVLSFCLLSITTGAIAVCFASLVLCS